MKLRRTRLWAALASAAAALGAFAPRTALEAGLLKKLLPGGPS